MALLLAYGYFGNLAESAFYSLIVLGPISAWVGPHFYRYMLSANGRQEDTNENKRSAA